LTKTGCSSLDTALRVLNESRDAAAIRCAVIDLGYEKSAEAYKILIERLDDSNPAVQHAAVVSLGRYGRPEAVEELIKPKIFRSPWANIRWVAVSAVGRLGDHRVIDPLIKAAEDPEWIVRTQAVAELMDKIRDIIAAKNLRLTRLLINMFYLDNKEIVDLAIEGFEDLGLESLPCLHDALAASSDAIRANAARALGRIRSSQSTPYLMELLKDDDARVRAAAAEALGVIGDKVAIEVLVGRVQDNVGAVQDRAVQALARIGKPATIPILNALTRERDKFAQTAYLKTLGLIRDPKSAPALIGCLRSSYFIVRQTAFSSLVLFGPSISNLLLPLLSYNKSDIDTLKKDACCRERPELQLRAVKALGGLEDHRVVALLKDLVEDSLPDVQEAAVHALFQIGCAAWGRCMALKVLAEVGDAALVPRIILSLRDHSENVRFEAVRALTRMGGPEAVKHLIRMARRDKADFVRTEAVRGLRRIGLGRPGVLDTALAGLNDVCRDVRSHSARLLGNFHDERSIPPLLKAIIDPHWSVRQSAEIALLNFGRKAVPHLVETLKSRSWWARFRAARLLGESGDSRAVKPLKGLIARKGERNSVRDIARASLAKLEKKDNAS
jgi:HEAT repeat protein